MKSFFKYLLASVLGVIVAGIILFLILMGSIGAMIASQDKPVEVKPNSVLHVQLNKPIADRSSDNPMQNFDFASLKPIVSLGLDDVLESIEKAKEDENIKGIYLDFTVIPAGIATIEEIRNALLDFKDSEKFIIAYADVYTQSSYYLASVADEIYLNPEGELPFVGMQSQVMFFKDALDKIGVEPQIIRHGKFKSAVEPFMLNSMSEANREQIETYMGSIWDHMVQEISTIRNIPVDELNELADNLTIRSAKAAVDYHLIDGLRYKDEILASLREKTEKEADEDIEAINLSKYIKAPHKTKAKKLAKDKIAVVYAMGEVIMGEGQEGTIGSDRISRAIREAREDTTIKAIVFRVNSGGGSALASEVIWREVQLAKQEKPVIASFGDVAASGGYYIAAPADAIVASPNTITGSIGVFGMIPNAEELLEEKIGVHTDVVKTNKHADMGSIHRALTAQEREIIQYGVEEIYQTFIEHVAQGRDMTVEEVDAIGQGRVWSGANAMEIGLIDEFGGLEKAIELAAAKAELEDYRTVGYPKIKDPFQQFLEELQGNVEASILKKHLGAEYKYYEEIQNLRQRSGIQARIPFKIEVY